MSYAQCYDDNQDSNHKVIRGLSTNRLPLDFDFKFQEQCFVQNFALRQSFADF
jgi:hypothetical protein